MLRAHRGRARMRLGPKSWRRCRAVPVTGPAGAGGQRAGAALRGAERSGLVLPPHFARLDASSAGAGLGLHGFWSALRAAEGRVWST